MEKKHYRPTPKSKLERLGTITGLLDKSKQYLVVGDKIQVGDYIGRLLYNRDTQSYGVFMGLWYGDKNEFDSDCYGKFIEIPTDNGMRMEITKLESY